jgi:hypothetical protein
MAFPTGPDLQNGICGSPAEALLTAEDASLPLDEFGCQGANQPLVCDHLRDVKARLERAAGKGAKGIRLANGDCDSFHIFFDGSEFRYWRH